MACSTSIPVPPGLGASSCRLLWEGLSLKVRMCAGKSSELAIDDFRLLAFGLLQSGHAE